MISVGFELRVKESLHILQHHSSRLALINKPKRFRKQIALISNTQLLASHREGGARNTTGKKINTHKGKGREILDIAFDDVPMGTVRSKCTTGILVDLNQRQVFESGPFKAKGLTPGAGANLN